MRLFGIQFGVSHVEYEKAYDRAWHLGFDKGAEMVRDLDPVQGKTTTDPEYGRGWAIGFDKGVEVGREMGPAEDEDEDPAYEDEGKVQRRARIRNNFTYHAPYDDQQERYERLRDEAKSLALMIEDLTPVSREQSLALTNLEQSIFWANASIARNECE